MVSPSSAAILGRVLLSMVIAVIGRHYIDVREKMNPALSMHIDEAHAIINKDTLKILAMAGSANVMTHLYSQSFAQIVEAFGSKDAAISAMSNTNTKIFMKAADADTAEYAVRHFGVKDVLSTVYTATAVTTRSVEKEVLREIDMMNLHPQECYMTSYSGQWAFVTENVLPARVKIVFPGVRLPDKRTDFPNCLMTTRPGHTNERPVPFICRCRRDNPVFSGGLPLEKEEGGSGDTSPEDKRRRVALSDASILWMGEKIITLEQAATIWLSPDEETPVSRPLFNKQEITEFWINEIEHRKHIRGTKARVIAKLLSILDRQGECPSVVRNPGFNECNNELNEDQFTRLSKIPLWRHSLSVASTIAGRTERAASVADAIIVALGHDLGKIPAYHEKTYATGDHPIISAAILNQISEFTSLANHLDLANAVRSHHNLGNTQAIWRDY